MIAIQVVEGSIEQVQERIGFYYQFNHRKGGIENTGA